MNRTKWFREAGFGMFIHWGLYSVAGRCEVVKYLEKIPDEEYRLLADDFRPKQGFAEEWVALAKGAGMKYLVLTTKHYDGFALFRSEASDYTFPKMVADRDLVEEYVKACRKAKMRVGLYYGLNDLAIGVENSQVSRKKEPELYRRWTRKIHGQVRELLSNYGPIDEFWFDNSANPRAPERKKLLEMVHKLQPKMLINNRTGAPGDFDTPEQHITAAEPGRLWEACMTMNKHWGYTPCDNLWKSPKELIHNLTGCAFREGNFLLNIGPKPDGTIPRESVVRLKEIGKWMRVNGEAIYGAERAPFSSGSAGVVTAKGKRYYLIVHWWPGEKLALPSVKIKIKSARILGTGQKLNLEYQGGRLILTDLPKRSPDPLCTVIVME